jgi:iron complex outermembrane recepter protein
MSNRYNRRVMSRLFATVSVVAIGIPSCASAQTPDANGNEVETVIVTGSLLRKAQQDMATPVISVDAGAIKATGTLNIGELVNYIPQNVGSMGGFQDLSKGGSDGHDSRSANLRGLGVGATLVLLNGHRVVASEGYVNLNSLVPDIEISRVETALGGTSAIYGADAVAGVMNIITDKRFEGFDISTQYTNVDPAYDYQIQARLGASGEKFHVVGSIAYTYQGRLQNSDRSVTNFFSGSSGTGANPGSFTMYSRPHTSTNGDVIINGVNYSQLYDNYSNLTTGGLSVVDPDCGADGSDSVFTAAKTVNRGTTTVTAPGYAIGTCSFNFQPSNPLRPESRGLLMHTDAEYDFAKDQKIYMEFAAYHQDSARYGVPSFAQNHNAGSAPVMPADNPYNPFGVDLQYTGRAIGAAGFAGIKYKVEKDEVNQFHGVIGAKGDLPVGDWQYDVSLVHSTSSILVKDKDTNMDLFQAALDGYGGPNCNYRWNGAGSGAVAGSGNCLWYSPFYADSQTQDASLIYNLQSNVFWETIRENQVFEASANGTLLTLPAGPMAAAVGVQYRREYLSTTYSETAKSGLGGFYGPSKDVSGARFIRSYFAEANVPIITDLNLDVAARYEDYGHFNSVSPKAELNWRAIPDFLSLRASYGKSFQAPGILNTLSGQIGVGVTSITDPIEGTTTFRTVVTEGNADLKAQKANSYNLGMTVLPLNGLSFSVDYWNYEYTNQILTQSAQAVINDDPSGSQVVRDTNGVAQTIYIMSFNAPSGTTTSGLDFATDYTMDLWGGIFNVRDTLTYLLAYDVDTGTLVYNGVGRRNATYTSPGSAAAAPRMRNLLTTSWSSGIHALSVTWRYTSSVWDDYGMVVTAKPTVKVGAFHVFDWQYRVALGQDGRYELNVGMINMFDTMPGTAKYTGYLPSVSDALGRQAYVKFGVHL